jgi:hypothetical protein
MPYPWRDLFRTDRAGYGDSLLIGIEEVNTVRADAQMLLEILPDLRTQFVAQVIEHQIGHLFAGLVGQYFLPPLSCRHVIRLRLLNDPVAPPTCHAEISARDEASSSRLKQ